MNGRLETELQSAKTSARLWTFQLSQNSDRQQGALSWEAEHHHRHFWRLTAPQEWRQSLAVTRVSSDLEVPRTAETLGAPFSDQKRLISFAWGLPSLMDSVWRYWAWGRRLSQRWMALSQSWPPFSLWLWACQPLAAVGAPRRSAPWWIWWLDSPWRFWVVFPPAAAQATPPQLHQQLLI